MNALGKKIDPRQYWEERARCFGNNDEGWKAVCCRGAPEYYNRLFHRLQRRAFLRTLRLSPEMVGLELGCGVGRWLVELSSRVKALHGLDISPTMIDQARNRLRALNIKSVYLEQFDGCRIPYRDACFDLSFSITVLIHIIDPNNLRRAVAELCRVTKPNGRIIILESFAPEPFSSPSHIRFRPEEEIIELFQKSGWGIKSSSPVCPFPPKETWLRTRTSRILFRAFSPLLYLLNATCRKLNIKGSPPVQKVHCYHYEGSRE